MDSTSHDWLNCNSADLFNGMFPGQSLKVKKGKNPFLKNVYSILSEKDVHSHFNTMMLQNSKKDFVRSLLQYLTDEVAIFSTELKMREIKRLGKTSSAKEVEESPLSQPSKSFKVEETPLPLALKSLKEKAVYNDRIMEKIEQKENNSREIITGSSPELEYELFKLAMLYYKDSGIKDISELNVKAPFEYMILAIGKEHYTIDGLSEALYDYVISQQNHPSSIVRDYFQQLSDGIVYGRKKYAMMKARHPLFGLAQQLMAISKDQQKLIVESVKKFTPYLFKYYATLAAELGFDIVEEYKEQKDQKNYRELLTDQFPTAARLLAISEKLTIDDITASVDEIWNSFKKTKYWDRQQQLIMNVWNIYQNIHKEDSNPFTFENYNKLMSDCNRLREACVEPETTPLPKSQRNRKETQPQQLPSHIDTEPPPAPVAPPVPTVKMLERPINRYLARIQRWFDISAENISHIRDFRDGEEERYAHYSDRELERQWLNHGFSLKVDELLSGSYGEYSYPTEKGLAMAAQVTYPDGTKQLGMINYGIDDKTCYHRMFTQTSMRALITKSSRSDLNAIPPYHNDDFDTELKDESSDTIEIDQLSGIATIKDHRTGCTINVFKHISG